MVEDSDLWKTGSKFSSAVAPALTISKLQHRVRGRGWQTPPGEEVGGTAQGGHSSWSVQSPREEIAAQEEKPGALEEVPTCSAEFWSLRVCEDTTQCQGQKQSDRIRWKHPVLAKGQEYSLFPPVSLEKNQAFQDTGQNTHEHSAAVSEKYLRLRANAAPDPPYKSENGPEELKLLK